MSDHTDTNKYKNWIFTWNADNDDNLLKKSEVQSLLMTLANTYAFQEEKGEETGRRHYQGCFQTKIRKRQQTLLNDIVIILSADPRINAREAIKNLTIQRMCGSWEQNIEYCTKINTSQSEPIVSEDLTIYAGNDIDFLGQPENRYPWQDKLLSILFKDGESILSTPNDRTIIWITDTKGNSGKSKFVKYVCYNNPSTIKVSFGSASQLRGSLVSAGKQNLYFLDIPRTLGDDDSMNSLLSVIEDLKNGFVVSTMYGKHSTLMMDPPHIIVFSNKSAPMDKLSADRWLTYFIDEDKYMHTYDALLS